MLFGPPSCRIAVSALLIACVLASLRLTIEVTRFSASQILESIILSVFIQEGVPIDTSFTRSGLEHQYISNYHEAHPLRPPHPYIRNLSSVAHRRPNPITRHVRLSRVTVLNISMLPVSLENDSSTPIRHQKHFNPALIPLPSHSKYPYLLVARLVTSGLHQESHVCFAELCSPDPSQQHRADTRACTAGDLALLGNHGGMRCVTIPERVNIPPTPARRCTGSWASFPDIPGFHDPRIFWSGRGEPIIEVNSGSQYGCVGLWIVDLRAIFPALTEILRKNSSVILEDKETRNKAGSMRYDDDGVDLSWLGPSIQYRYITEITKNPRHARSEVEKNWVMFFPREDEAWVQYDLIGRLVSKGSPEASFQQEASEDFVPSNSVSAQSSFSSIAPRLSTEQIVEGSDFVGPRQARRGFAVANSSSHVLATTSRNITSPLRMTDLGRPHNSSNISISSLTIPSHTSNPATSNTAPLAADSNTVDTASTSPSITPNKHEREFIKGGRTIAMLSWHAYSTPNLIHPLEHSCFDLLSHSHTHDNLNNTDHWHQGTNSLRLILCTRAQITARTCLYDTNTTTPPHNASEKDMAADEYEELLLDLGLVVHIALVHRKFSNEMDLPMRYERYLVIWEARPPFQMVAISQHPILFGGEMARPWSAVENEIASRSVESGTTDSHHEISKKTTSRKREEIEPVELDVSSQAYFTYTPSLTWTHRAAHSRTDIEHDQRRGHEDLGTGYLDDEVLVGIGMDDLAQGLARVDIREVVRDLRFCEDLYADSWRG